jgi:hypothetical protein
MGGTILAGGIIALVVSVGLLCYTRLQGGRRHGMKSVEEAEDPETTTTGHSLKRSGEEQKDEETPEVYTAIKGSGEEQKEEETPGVYAFNKACSIFPGLMKGTKLEEYESKTQALKKHLWRNIDQRVDSVDPSLLESKNASGLCVALGMDEHMVEQRFKAIANFGQELGITMGKTPIVESIFLLIDYLEVKNPLGAVSNKIEHSFRGNDNHSNICVRMERGRLSDSIDLVKGALAAEEGFNNLFMHGTKAAVPKCLVESGIKISGSGGGRHDFGNGLYCFRNDLCAALSFGVDRSFSGENPVVIAFLEPLESLNIVDLNTYSYRERRWKTLFRKNKLLQKYDDFLLRRRETWSSDNLSWKTFVSACRFYAVRFLVSEKTVFMGWLHKCMTTRNTNMGEEPEIDDDGWVQYCFTAPAVAGEKMLFIEFVFDYKQWGEDTNEACCEAVEAEVVATRTEEE